jgi:hypothetical protein
MRTAVLRCSLFTVFLACAANASATVYDAMDFFLSPPGACTAETKANGGSYFRIYEIGACGSYRSFGFAKGKPVWATESFILREGMIRLMIELSYSGSSISSYRAFRDLTNGEKGMTWMQQVFDNSAFWWMPPYNDEYWTNAQGVPVCLNTDSTEVRGALEWQQVQYIGILHNFIRDQRSSSPSPSTWHDAEAILLTMFWDGVTEEYTYARWINPWTGRQESLGLVKFAWYQDGVLQSTSVKNTIVDCSTSVTCTTCPP